MAEALSWKRLLDTGQQFMDDRTLKARRLVSELAEQGERTTSEVSAAVEDLVAQSRRRGDDLEQSVRATVRRQLDALDLATEGVLAAVSYRLFGGRGHQRSRRSNAG